MNERAFDQSIKEHRAAKKRVLVKILSVIGIFIGLGILIAVIAFANGKKDSESEKNPDESAAGTPNSEISVSPEDINPNATEYMEFGISLENDKPMRSQRVGIRYPLTNVNGGRLAVNVYAGDTYTYYQQFGGGPTFDAYGEGGYPFLTVELTDCTSNDKLLIEGCENSYEKKFSQDEMAVLDYDSSYKNLLYNESIELDFSEFKEGSHGEVSITFGWKDIDQAFESEGNGLWHRCFLSFYVGKNGIGFSHAGWEAAKNEL